MTTAYIVEAVRTAGGRRGGRLAGVHPVDLLAQSLDAIVARSGIDPSAIDDVITGCVSQAGEQAMQVGRMGVLASKLLSQSTPAVTIDRQCGSSQQAIQFAAWLGLTPRPHCSGGKERLGGITKQGDRYLRRLLVVGNTAVIRITRKDHAKQPWLARLLETKPAKIASVVQANKTARIAWVIMSNGEVYRSAVA